MTFREFLERIEDNPPRKLPFAYQPTEDQLQFQQAAQQEARLKQNIKDKLIKAMQEPQNAHMYVSQLVDPHTGDLNKVEIKNKNLVKYLQDWLLTQHPTKPHEDFPGQINSILKTALTLV
jgi:hypothetical protein